MRLLILVIFAIVFSGCTNKSAPILAGGKPVDEWVRALSAPDAKLRKKAADKLGNVGASDPAVVAALCGALQDKDADVRCEAILALVKCGPAAKDAVEPLKSMGRLDHDPRVRNYAIKALAKLEK
jgi:HEAT repeat protein